MVIDLPTALQVSFLVGVLASIPVANTLDARNREREYKRRAEKDQAEREARKREAEEESARDWDMAISLLPPDEREYERRRAEQQRADKRRAD
jgi:hypothetical protein